MMRKKSALLSGAALGVLLAAGLGASADAKTVKHHHRAAAPASSALAEKVETLTAAVSTLESRLNEEAQARQATEAQVQAAQADASAARADAQAAHTELAEQIQTLPGTVNSAVAANTPKPKPSWTDNTKLGATVFVDVSNISQSPKPNKINGTGADIKRAYLSVDHKFNDIYSANLTVDLAPNGIVLNGPTFGTGGLQGSEVIKYAYMQAKYADAFVIQLGAEKTPWIPFVEDIYGYRYVDKVMIDQNKFGNSSDWGANIHGDLAHGLVSYSVSAVDGDGYKVPERSEQMDFEGRVNVNYKGFVAAVGGYDGKLSDNIQVPSATANPAPQTASRVDALLAYTNSKVRLGVEYFDASDWKVVPKITPDKSEGFSAFGSYNFTPQWSVFGRYDGLSPSQKLASAERYTYYNIGVGYEPVKTIDLGLVYKHEDITHAPLAGYTDATTTLAPTKAGGSAQYDEVGIFTQFKF
jgi:hypothetical protein